MAGLPLVAHWFVAKEPGALHVVPCWLELDATTLGRKKAENLWRHKELRALELQ